MDPSRFGKRLVVDCRCEGKLRATNSYELSLWGDGKREPVTMNRHETQPFVHPDAARLLRHNPGS